MKSTLKVNKSPAAKLRAQIILEKLPNEKKQSYQSSDSDNSQNSYDSQVQGFANQFYDEAVKQADQQNSQNKDNQMKQQQTDLQNKKNTTVKPLKKHQTQWDKISSRLKQFKNNFSDLDMDALLFKKKDENKLKQIAQFLAKKHKEKKEFIKKLKKIKKSENERLKIEEEIKKKKEKEQHHNRLKEIRKLSIMIKEKIQKKKDEQESKLEDIEAFYEQFRKKYKNRKLYQLMELCDKKKKHIQIEKERQYLKQHRDYMSQIASNQQIAQFSKKQEELLRDIEKVKQAEKNQKNIQIAQKNKELQEKIYISNKYVQIQEESAKKNHERQAPKEKIDKIKKYNAYIREHFLPQSNLKNQEDDEDQNQKRSQQVQSIIIQIGGKLYKKVKKDRYLKGEKIGEMFLNVPLPKTEKEIKMVGNSYLQQLKLLPKKRHSTSLDLSRKNSEKPMQKSMTPRIQIPKMEKKIGKIKLSKNPDRHEILNLINSLKAKDEAIFRQQHYLKSVRREEHEGREQLDQNLLDNIQKKINLLGRL